MLSTADFCKAALVLEKPMLTSFFRFSGIWANFKNNYTVFWTHLKNCFCIDLNILGGLSYELVRFFRTRISGFFDNANRFVELTVF